MFLPTKDRDAWARQGQVSRGVSCPPAACWCHPLCAPRKPTGSNCEGSYPEDLSALRKWTATDPCSSSPDPTRRGTAAWGRPRSGRAALLRGRAARGQLPWSHTYTAVGAPGCTLPCKRRPNSWTRLDGGHVWRCGGVLSHGFVIPLD